MFPKIGRAISWSGIAMSAPIHPDSNTLAALTPANPTNTVLAFTRRFVTSGCVSVSLTNPLLLMSVVCSGFPTESRWRTPLLSSIVDERTFVRYSSRQPHPRNGDTDASDGWRGPLPGTD